MTRNEEFLVSSLYLLVLMKQETFDLEIAYIYLLLAALELHQQSVQQIATLSNHFRIYQIVLLIL